MTQPILIIAGDLCLRGRIKSLSSSQLSQLLQDVQPILKSADASLVNLETAVVGAPLPAIPKSGPAIGTDVRVLDLLHEVGFSGLTLANNHFADYGAEGVQESLRLIEQHNLWHVGAGMNAEEAALTKYLQVGDKKLAVINACEHEFTIATKGKPGCNALNPIRQYKAIQEAKQIADYVLVIIHGGVEHYQLPTPRMQETYRFFIEAGADAVINHHQHCYSGYEFYQGKPIVYGLGNFFFDWPGQDANWNKGYMVKLTFGDKIGLELIPYIQNAEEVGFALIEGNDKIRFDEHIKVLNTLISTSEQLQSQFVLWTKQRKDDYMRIILPKEGGARLKSLIPTKYHKYFMPEYMTAERRLLLKSLFQCEAHNDVMNELLN